MIAHVRRLLGAQEPIHALSRRGFEHVPALDALRGVAVLLVMLMHIPPTLVESGFVGVMIFFSLSGFLITSILLSEWRSTGHINLKNFYWNRFLRLAPAVIVALLIATIYNYWSRGTVSFLSFQSQHAISVLFYYANWFQSLTTGYDQKLVPLWSLSVEEQFYLVWPPILLFVLKRHLSFKDSCVLLSAAILIPFLFRIYRTTEVTSMFTQIYFHTETWIDSLFWGILTAALLQYRRDWVEDNYVLVQRLALIGCVVIGWHAVQHNMLHYTWIYRGGFAVIAISTSIIIAAMVITPLPASNQIPEVIRPFVDGASKFLVWTGRISYGLYVWNSVVLFIVVEQLPKLGNWQWPLIFLLNYLTAVLSFYGLEQPLRKRFKDYFRERDDAPQWMHAIGSRTQKA